MSTMAGLEEILLKLSATAPMPPDELNRGGVRVSLEVVESGNGVIGLDNGRRLGIGGDIWIFKPEADFDPPNPGVFSNSWQWFGTSSSARVACMGRSLRRFMNTSRRSSPAAGVHGKR